MVKSDLANRSGGYSLKVALMVVCHYIAKTLRLCTHTHIHILVILFDRATFLWPWKMVSVSARRFISQEMKRSKHGLFVFPPFVLQYDVKAKYRLISRKFSGMKFFHRSARLTNHRPRAFVSVRQTNEIALFPFVCCFCFVRAFSFQVHTKIGSNMQCSGKRKSENSSSVVWTALRTGSS